MTGFNHILRLAADDDLVADQGEFHHAVGEIPIDFLLKRVVHGLEADLVTGILRHAEQVTEHSLFVGLRRIGDPDGKHGPAGGHTDDRNLGIRDNVIGRNRIVRQVDASWCFFELQNPGPTNDQVQADFRIDGSLDELSILVGRFRFHGWIRKLFGKVW